MAALTSIVCRFDLPFMTVIAATKTGRVYLHSGGNACGEFVDFFKDYFFAVIRLTSRRCAIFARKIYFILQLFVFGPRAIAGRRKLLISDAPWHRSVRLSLQSSLESLFIVRFETVATAARSKCGDSRNGAHRLPSQYTWF
ncbi:hypothetical protein T281_09965 [Rhodomicrobium udaipurense JA643]|nr:hypothetical protein T281_09965 [Rhodomicrobium udaipurense JA643]